MQNAKFKMQNAKIKRKMKSHGKLPMVLIWHSVRPFNFAFCILHFELR